MRPIPGRTRRSAYDGFVPPSSSLADELRSRGLRLTAQRQLVLEAVYALGHATPDQVHAEVAETAAGVNITTVYRTLELLEELGLVTHAHLSHGAPTYHARRRAAARPPGVPRCGGSTRSPPSCWPRSPSRWPGSASFLVDVGHVALFGVCGGCGGEA